MFVCVDREPGSLGDGKEKSPTNEEDSQGVCCPCVTSRTAMRTRLNTSSMPSPGVRMTLSNSCVYSPLRACPSLATAPGAVAYAINVPLGAFMDAKPRAADRKLRANGLFRHASRITIFMGFLALS